MRSLPWVLTMTALVVAGRVTAREPFPLAVVSDGAIEDAVVDGLTGKIWLPLDHSHEKSLEEVREEFPEYRLARMEEVAELSRHVGVEPTTETGVDAFVPEYREPVRRVQELLGVNLRWPSGLRYSRGRVLETSETVGIEGCHRYFTFRVNNSAGMAVLGGHGACTRRAASDSAAWWLVKDPAPVDFRRGDAWVSGSINLSDGVYILNYLFLGGPEPLCHDAVDVDDSGVIDLGDAVRLFGVLFLGANPVPAPGFECGPDPTEDALPCERYEHCP